MRGDFRFSPVSGRPPRFGGGRLSAVPTNWMLKRACKQMAAARRPGVVVQGRSPKKSVEARGRGE